jgi:aminoglycoside phosphotransferase (APT) family kinase protein
MVSDMPAAEVEVGVQLVRDLLADQFPALADRRVSLLANGWDNFTFKVGDDLVARLPRRSLSATLVEHEAEWLPSLAPGLPLPVPAPRHLGQPGRGYPWHWVISPWIDGEALGPMGTEDHVAAADDLGAFLAALHRPAPSNAPKNEYRGIPLRERDESTRRRLIELADRVESELLLERWDAALASPAHSGQPLWIHGDLHPLNLLAHDGRLTGVIDFGDITSGDPATDLAVAWMLFEPSDRPRFRSAYGRADDATWERARGWAISLATSYMAYSGDNPLMGEIGIVTIERLTT